MPQQDCFCKKRWRWAEKGKHNTRMILQFFSTVLPMPQQGSEKLVQARLALYVLSASVARFFLHPEDNTNLYPTGFYRIRSQK